MVRQRLTVLCVGLCILAGLPLVAQENDAGNDGDGWERYFASPTYGISLATLTLEYNEDAEYNTGEMTVTVPGFELRIYNGTNIADRGGFYTGYEVGTQFYLLSESDTVAVYTGGTDDQFTDYHIESLMCGLVFIMSKYGYRVDLGTDEGGMSIGPQIGIGLVLGGGGVDIVNDETGDSFSADTEMVFGPMLEGMVEAAFRFGKNFRVLGAVGATVSPMMEWDGEDDDEQGTIDGEMLPVRPSFRLGFALNY